jgi:hypothetical protein
VDDRLGDGELLNENVDTGRGAVDSVSFDAGATELPAANADYRKVK